MKPYLTLGLSLATLAVSAKSNQQPNILFIFADQWRAQSLGYAGNSDVRTPIIDHLATESVNFTNAVSNCPVSGPYRASLLTGTYPLTHGIFYNDKPIAKNLPTLGETFKEAGYQTAYIGKWHVDGYGRETFIPQERRMGFDYWRVLECTHNYNQSYYYGDSPEKKQWQGYDAKAQTEELIRYLRQSDRDKPFLAVLSWGPPHDPYQTAPEEFRAIYKERSKISLRSNVKKEDRDRARLMLSGYYAHIAALDTYMGDILQTLNELKIDQNTIVVFTSDHGDMLLSHGGVNKQQPFDESIRVPFLLRYPARYGSKGKEIKSPIGTTDIFPTLLSLCGIPIPQSVEGRDFTPYISRGKSDDDAQLIACYIPFHQWNYARGGREYRGIRTSRYTYAETLKGAWLLYDNEKDPFQMNNLVDRPEMKKVQQQMQTLLSRKLKATGDKFLHGDTYMQRWNYSYDGNEIPMK